MKTRIITLLILLTSIASAGAQDLLEMIKRDLNSERRTIVAEAVTIPLDQETEFWKMYSEMEQKLDILSDKRAKNIMKFADNYDDISDDVADDLAKTYFDIISARTKINRAYYKKAAKLISKKEAARFIQLLGQIQLLIDIQIAAEVPLIK